MLQFLSESLLNASCEVLLFVLQIYSLYWKRKMEFVLTQLRQARIHNGICDIDGLWSYCSNATVWIVVCFFRILLYGVIFLGTGGRLLTSFISGVSGFGVWLVSELSSASASAHIESSSSTATDILNTCDLPLEYNPIWGKNIEGLICFGSYHVVILGQVFCIRT